MTQGRQIAQHRPSGHADLMGKIGDRTGASSPQQADERIAAPGDVHVSIV
jgi:hypothetical protein